MDDRENDRPADNEEDAPTGGDETTEEQLDADNAVEEDQLKTFEPGAPA